MNIDYTVLLFYMGLFSYVGAILSYVAKVLIKLITDYDIRYIFGIEFRYYPLGFFVIAGILISVAMVRTQKEMEGAEEIKDEFYG